MAKAELKQCFVIAPIGDDGSDIRKRSDQVLKHIVKPAAGAAGYTAVRADEMDKPGLITSQVIQRVVNDPLVIADLTGMNPNVFYELAIRHAIRKPLVQLIEKGERIPFDIAGTRTIHVDHKDLDSVASAKDEIGKQIAALQNPVDVETPISTALDLQNLRQSENPKDRDFAEVLAEISEIRLSITKLSDSPVARDDDTRRLLSRLEDLTLRDGPSRNWSSKRMEQELYNITRISVLEGGPPFRRALSYATLANYADGRIPWLAEGAREVFRQMMSGTDARIDDLERRFRDLIDQAMSHPATSDSPGSDSLLFEVVDRLRLRHG